MISFSEWGAYGRYLFEYRHDGSEWGLEIVAKSPEDARQRLKALSWATYKGEIAAKMRRPGHAATSTSSSVLRLESKPVTAYG